MIVSAPKFATRAQIESTLKKHVDWIIKKLQQERTTQEIIGDPVLLQSIDYHGESYPIVTTPGAISDLQGKVSSFDPVFISTSEKRIYVHTLPEDDLDSPEMNAYLHKVIHQKLFSCASVSIPNLVMNLGKLFELLPKRVIVKEQKSRWGSCSTNRSIYMNWRLIQAPDSVLHYVAIHELAHLQEHNHSNHFWNLVESMMPSYHDERKWLKVNGSRLFLLHNPAQQFHE